MRTVIGAVAAGISSAGQSTRKSDTQCADLRTGKSGTQCADLSARKSNMQCTGQRIQMSGTQCTGPRAAAGDRGRALKRIAAALLSIIIAFSAYIPASAASSAPNIEAASAILVDVTTGKILYEKNAHDRMYPASTTKMMTAILFIENCADAIEKNEMVVSDAEAYATGGTRLCFITDEEIGARDLLYGTMVVSANDGAVGLAHRVAGTTEAFAEMMNAKAKELGCEDTHFTNPHGLNDDNHYSSAYDMYLIAAYCMQNELFRDVVSTKEYTIPATNKTEEPRECVTTNALLADDYEGILGIKTGYTSQAGGCLASAAKRDQTQFICVIMNSSAEGRFTDSEALLDWAFSNYRTLTVMENGNHLGNIKVKGGEFNNVDYEIAADIVTTLTSDAAESILRTEVSVPMELDAPVTKGQRIGEISLYQGSMLMDVFPVVASKDIKEGGFLSRFYVEDSVALKIKYGLIGFAAFLFISFVIWILVMRHKTKVRKAQKAAKIKAMREAELRKRAEWERQYEARYTDREKDRGKEE